MIDLIEMYNKYLHLGVCIRSEKMTIKESRKKLGEFIVKRREIGKILRQNKEEYLRQRELFQRCHNWGR